MYFLKSLLSINFSKNAHFIEEITPLPDPLQRRGSIMKDKQGPSPRSPRWEEGFSLEIRLKMGENGLTPCPSLVARGVYRDTIFIERVKNYRENT